jgi:NAD(P)-dependent dehydrogenase (short-subunit alcohol dehydrogenase family)
MDLGLQDKRAVITGASKGIGRATALTLAAEGCDVHLVARSESDLAALAADIRANTMRTVTWSALDLSVSSNVDDLCREVSGFDILINNAGAIPAGTLAGVDEQTWRSAWDLKVFGYINMCRRVYADMQGRGGVIINIIGVGGERQSPGYVAGAGGNAALMGITRALGGSSMQEGIRVVGINPGLIETERLVTMQRVHAQNKLGDPERWREMLDPDFPPGQPAHIADMVAFLSSDRSSNTSGTIITIDGGLCAR